MTCANCHTHNFRDYKYCRECGSKLEAPAAVPTPGATSVLAIPVSPAETPVDLLLQETMSLLDQDDLLGAAERARAAIVLAPASAAAHSALALVLERQGNLREAAEQLQLVVQLDPESSADETRLRALRAQLGDARPLPRWTPTRIAFASAGFAAVVVFGAGFAILNSGARKSPTETTRVAISGASLSGASPTSASSRNAPVPASGPLLGTPGAGGAPPVGIIGRGGGSTPRPLPATANTMPVRAGSPQTRAMPGAPVQRIGLPRIVDTPPVPAPSTPALAPAAIGKIVPIPASGSPTPLAADPSASRPAERVPTGTVPAPNAPAAKTREPVEPDTGFIKIEPLGGAPSGAAAPSAAGAAAKAQSPPRVSSGGPSISVSFGPSQVEGPGLEEGQREERAAAEAQRKKDGAGAALHLGAASRVYEAIARRGGAEARQAAERLEALRKRLAEPR